MTKARDLSNIPAGGGDLNVDSGTLFVDASENRVGIGTSSPDTNLHIEGSGSTPLKVESATSASFIQLTDSGNTCYIAGANGSFKVQNSDGSGFTDKLVLDTSGVINCKHSVANGPYITSDSNGISVANGAALTLASTRAGGLIISAYDQGSGEGGVFFATYTASVAKIAGDGSTSDSGSTFAVFKSTNSHTVSFKNRYGSTRTFSIAVYSAGGII